MNTTRPRPTVGATPPRMALRGRVASNPMVVPSSFDPRRATSETPSLRPLRPKSRTAQPATDAETVVARLEEAGQTLLCLPRSGPSTALRQTRHQYVAEALEAYAAEDRPRLPVPLPGRITRMDQALAWIPLIPADKLVIRRIVGSRCLVSPLTGRHLFSWRRLARLLGADHKAIQRWHATGIDTIVATLNRDAALVRSWDNLG